MAKLNIEQLILVIWTFTATLIDLYESHIHTSIFNATIAIILAGIVYYIIGFVILVLINSIYKLFRGGQQ